jgi:hypothetical protein
MATRIDLLSGIVRLEDILNQINPEQKDIELFTYSLLSSSRLDYISNLDSELESISNDMINTSPEDFDAIKKLSIKARSYSWLTRYGHAPAYIVCLNFDPDSEHELHRFRGDTNHIFKNKNFMSKDIKLGLNELGYKDGAILIKPNGTIYTVRTQLTNIDPKDIIKLENDENLDENDPKNYGFKETVNVRHFSAIGASFHLKNTILYTLSEETGNIRRYQNGKISFSTLQEEDSFPNHHISNLI